MIALQSAVGPEPWQTILYTADEHAMVALYGRMNDKKVTEWIRSRAASGEPLNLHAVNREAPEILRHVFRGPKPHGWRRSLLDAGVDPYDIVHHLEDQVACQICGKSFVLLTRHLIRIHGVTGEEYREEFGEDAELSSETSRAAKFKNRPQAGIEHWEYLWSEYYVLDWIIRLHDEGHPLNYYHMVKIATSLAGCALNFFGSWDAALKMVGLDPEDVRLKPAVQSWDHEKVIEKLHEVAAERKRGRKRRVTTDLQLAAKRRFGSFRAACKVAGIKYEDFILREAAFPKQAIKEVVDSIRKLENLKGLERRKKLIKIYQNEKNQRIITGHYSSLQKLAVREGIELRVVSIKAYRDEDDVEHDLDLLESEGKRLCCSNFLNTKYKRLYNVVKETGWGIERLEKMKKIPAE